MNDFDSPWKEILDAFFPEFVAFFFPRMNDLIDWQRGVEFLDKELQQVAKEAEIGRRVVDKLVKVWRLDGGEEWMLVHIEIQTQTEVDFSERIFVYNYRLFDRYNRKVASLAVLADDSPTWRPNAFGYEIGGFRLSMEFPTAKLLDYRDRQNELSQSENPFATVVLAHLSALETSFDTNARSYRKTNLVKSLYHRGWEKKAIVELFRFIDWILGLPAELEKVFWSEIFAFEEESRMPFITSVEKIGIEKGLEEGLEKGLETGLERGLKNGIACVAEIRFPQEVDRILNWIEGMDSSLLQKTLQLLKRVASVDELFAAVKSSPIENDSIS